MLRQIARELKEHAPFTAIGAVSGVLIMLIIVLVNVLPNISEAAFLSVHPIHVILSATATTSMYRKYAKGKIWMAILIGYLGSVGIATLSDAVIPFLGGTLLGIEIEFHLPFIEAEKMPILGISTWLVISSAAVIGIIIGYLKPTTKIPHLSHVLLSTWASLFYFTAFGRADWLPLLPLIFVFLFLSVWLPCCISDIAFPLFFIRRKLADPDQVNYNLKSKETAGEC